MKIKLVIFDLDNTLIITKPAAKAAYRQAVYFLARQHGLDKQRDKLYNHWKRLVSQVLGERKPHLRRFAYSLQVLIQAHKIPETYFAQSLNTYERELLKGLELQKGAKEILSLLQEKKIIIAVATGSERSESIKKLKRTGLYPFIDHLVTSTDIGAMKPDTQYYLQVLKQTKIKPTQTLVVGDHQAEDLTPAKSIGCHTYLLKGPNLHLMSLKSLLE